jgi:bacterioferritin
MRSVNKEIISVLNDVLTGELTAINQYFIHSKMCGDWGYDRLHDKIRAESIDEMRHAEQLIERILYLGGVPNGQRMSKLRIGESVLEQLKSDLGLELAALPRLNQGIDLATQEGDNGTRALLESILTSEEEHVDWLEAQLELIDQTGIQNYLAAQIRE